MIFMSNSHLSSVYLVPFFYPELWGLLGRNFYYFCWKFLQQTSLSVGIVWHSGLIYQTNPMPRDLGGHLGWVNTMSPLVCYPTHC